MTHSSCMLVDFNIYLGFKVFFKLMIKIPGLVTTTLLYNLMAYGFQWHKFMDIRYLHDTHRRTDSTLWYRSLPRSTVTPVNLKQIKGFKTKQLKTVLLRVLLHFRK